MNLNNKYAFLFAAIIGISLYLIVHFFFDDSITIVISILVLLLVIMIITFIMIIFLILRETSITNYFGMTIKAILGVSLAATILLTILLGLQWIPTYFNSIYILLGSIIVTIIGLYINKQLEKEKESRKIRRIIYIVNNTIKTNKNTAETLLLNKLGGIKTNSLKKGFWDILSSNIIDVDLDPEIVRNLVTIKEVTYEINDLTIIRNKLLDFLYSGMPIDMDLLDKYDDEELAELIQQNNVLTVKLEKLVEKSSEYLDKYEDFELVDL